MLLALLLHLCAAALWAAAPAAGKEDVPFQWAEEGWYNPSLVNYDGKFMSMAKRTERESRDDKSWWLNTIFLCGPDSDAQRLACARWDPWATAKVNYTECEYTTDIRNGRVDNSGLGDVKLWTWPGRGVYAIFGRKPQRAAAGGSKYCDQLVVYQQFIAQVRARLQSGRRLPGP